MDGIGVNRMDGLLGVAGGIVGFLFGGWTVALTIFLTIQMLDVATGLLKAMKHRKLDSTEMREGLIRKFGVWLIIILAHFVDLLVFQDQPLAVTAMTFTFIGQEGISILENLAEVGVNIPPAMTKYFKKIEDKGGALTEEGETKQREKGEN